MLNENSELCIVLSYGEKDYIPVDTFYLDTKSYRVNKTELKFINKNKTSQIIIPIQDNPKFRELIEMAYSNGLTQSAITEGIDTTDSVDLINKAVGEKIKKDEDYIKNGYKIFKSMSLDELDAKISIGSSHSSNYSVVPFITQLRIKKIKTKDNDNFESKNKRFENLNYNYNYYQDEQEQNLEKRNGNNLLFDKEETRKM